MFIKNKRNISFLVFFIFVIVGITIMPFRRSGFRKPLSTILAKIPEEDQLILEDLFHKLIVETSFGYVLYGDKPFSEIQYVNPASELYFGFRFDPGNLRLRKGIECWRKYCRLFHSKNFLFVFPDEPKENTYIEVRLINKIKLLEVVKNHLIKFQRIYGSNFTQEKLLNKLTGERDFWDNSLDYETIGILFGYGSNNSHIFQRLCELKDGHSRRFTLRMKPLTPSRGYSSVEDEIADLSCQFQFLEDEYPLDGAYIQFPGFKAKLDSEETQRIVNELYQTRKKMIKIYRNGNFFKNAMKQYIGD